MAAILGEANDLTTAAAQDDSEAPPGAYWYTAAFLIPRRDDGR
jgi:hypothetical protein